MAIFTKQYDNNALSSNWKQLVDYVQPQIKSINITSLTNYNRLSFILNNTGSAVDYLEELLTNPYAKNPNINYRCLTVNDISSINTNLPSPIDPIFINGNSFAKDSVDRKFLHVFTGQHDNNSTNNISLLTIKGGTKTKLIHPTPNGHNFIGIATDFVDNAGRSLDLENEDNAETLCKHNLYSADFLFKKILLSDGNIVTGLHNYNILYSPSLYQNSKSFDSYIDWSQKSYSKLQDNNKPGSTTQSVDYIWGFYNPWAHNKIILSTDIFSKLQLGNPNKILFSTKQDPSFLSDPLQNELIVNLAWEFRTDLTPLLYQHNSMSMVGAQGRPKSLIETAKELTIEFPGAFLQAGLSKPGTSVNGLYSIKLTNAENSVVFIVNQNTNSYVILCKDSGKANENGSISFPDTIIQPDECVLLGVLYKTYDNKVLNAGDGFNIDHFYLT